MRVQPFSISSIRDHRGSFAHAVITIIGNTIAVAIGKISEALKWVKITGISNSITIVITVRIIAYTVEVSIKPFR